MKISPKILGGALFVPVFGFACGALAAATIDTRPVAGTPEDYLADIPAQEQQSISVEEARAMKASADHYPLETPEGTIEVAELAYHGRLRNRLSEHALYEARHGEGYLHETAADQRAEPVPDMIWPVDPAQVTEINVHEGVPLDADAQVSAGGVPPTSPRDNNQPVRPEIAFGEASAGGPRVVDVRAELATHQ